MPRLAPWVLLVLLPLVALRAQEERPPEALAVAIGMQQRGLHEEAARYFGEFLAKHRKGPFVAEAHYRLATSQSELGQRAAARASLEAALARAEPGFALRPEARYRLGNLLQADGEHAAAAAQFAALRTEVPGDHYLLAAAAYAEGECRRDAGDDEAAAAAFAAAVAAATGEHQGYRFPSLYQLGFCELRADRNAAAVAAFAAAAAAAPDDAARGESWFLAGDAALRVPDVDAAAAHFERARALPGEHVDDALHGLGFVAIARGDGAAVRAAFRALLAAAPQSPLAPSARLELARSWYQDREPGKALAELQRLPAEGLTEDLARQARELRGLCELASGDAGAAIANLQQALAQAGPAEAARLWLALGEAHAGQQQWDEALAAYGKVADASDVALRGDALYGSCFALHSLGRFAESNAAAEALLALRPPHRLAGEARFAIAENHFAQRDYAAAERGYAAIDAKSAQGDAAAWKLAWCRYLQGDEQAAAPRFAAIAQQRDSPFAEEALSMQALAASEAGDAAAALAAADRYLARYPQGAHAERCLRVAARVLQQRGDLAGARQRLERAAAAARRRQGHDAGADQMQQAELAFLAGDYKAADALYAPLLERADALGARAAVGRAWCAFELGDDAGCAAWLAAAERHRELGDAAAGALDLRIALHHRQADWAAAIVACRRFLQRFPEHARGPQVRYALGVAEARSGDHAAAVATLAALAKDGTHARTDLVHYELGWACRRAQDEPAALLAFAAVAASSADPELAGEANLHLGTAALESGDLPAARELLTKVAGTHRGRALYQLAFAEFERSRGDRALLAAARDRCDAIAAVPNEPLAPEALYLGAECCVQLGDRRAAVQRLTALLEAAPRHERAARARLLLGDCAVALGDGGLAIPALEEFLRGEPVRAEAARAQLLLGKARLLRGEAERAERALAAVLDLDDGAFAAEAQYRIGEARRARGDLQGATDAFVKLPILYTHAEWVRRGLLQAGLVYEEQKQRDKALRIFRELVEKHAGSEEAKAARKHLEDG